MTVTLLNYINVQDAMDHLVAIEQEISTAVGQILGQNFGTAAKPFMRYEAEAIYPKWLNGISTIKPQPIGIWEDAEVTAIVTELQLGKRTEGFDGALEEQLYTWIPYTMAMGRSRPLLTSDAKPGRINNFLGASLELTTPLMPGDIIAAKFLWTLGFYLTNPERDY